MGKLRQIGKKIKKGMGSLGKKLKSGFGKVAKAFGKLGPLGSIALSFLLPGMGNLLSGWLGQMGTFGKTILKIGSKIQQGANYVKDGVGRVFNRVTDALEAGMNAVSKPFMKPDITGARGAGSAFRDFVSDATGGFIDKSTVGLQETKIVGNEVTTTLIDADNYDLSKDFKTGEFNNPTDAKRISDLQGENKLRRDVDSFQAKNDMNSFKRMETTEGVDFYKRETLEDGTYGSLINPDKASRSFTNQSLVPKEVVAPKKSLFAEGDYDSFKARVKGSKEMDLYKKIGPIQAVGSGILAGEDAEAAARMNSFLAQNARANAIANETLSMITPTYDTTTEQYVNINNLDNDPTGMQRMTSGYGLILGDFYS